MTTLDRIHKTTLKAADVRQLLEVTGPFLLSIYLPTHSTGDEVLQMRDAKTLEGYIREIEGLLREAGLEAESIEGRLHPLKELAKDAAFWRQRTEGLALFATASTLFTADLPYRVAPEFRMAETFFLPPLAPLLSGSDEYYLLALELERIRLFKAGRDTFEEIHIQELFPDRLEDRVGYDYEQKSLQHRSQSPRQGVSSSHGHDEADRDRKNEILRYFREVDEGLMPVLREAHLPLILASQDYLAALYKAASSYRPITETVLTTNLSEAHDARLHRESWDAMRPVFQREMHAKRAKFEELHGTGKASAQASVILPAAFDGKVDSLFIAEGKDVRGMYNEEDCSIAVADHPQPFTESLINFAMRETLRNGGAVFSQPADDMPEGSRGMAALFRY